MSSTVASTSGGTLVVTAPPAAPALAAPPADAPSTSRTGPVAEVLTLRLLPKRKKKSVKWTEDTVEVNEHMDKKKSKKCCIFHKQRKFGEWSDGEDSDQECDCGPMAMASRQPSQQQQEEEPGEGPSGSGGADPRPSQPAS